MLEEKLKKLFETPLLEEFSKHVNSGETPLWQYWPEFVEKYLRTGKSAVTVARVRDLLRFVIKTLGLYSIEQINNPKILEETLFTYKNSTHISNTTYNTYLKNLNTYFIWLYKHEYIANNNITKIDRCKEDINEQYTLNEDQVKLLVARAHDRRQARLQRLRNVLFIDLLRFTGARPCELLNIQMKDITLEGETYKLVIRGKKQKGRNRYYHLPSYLRDSYESYIQRRSLFRENETYLFVSTSKQGAWTQKGMRGLFRALSKELGFKVIAYGFRRYVATKLNTNGLSMKDIGHFLGHSRESTTERYIERSCILTDKGTAIMGNKNIYNCSYDN